MLGDILVKVNRQSKKDKMRRKTQINCLKFKALPGCDFQTKIMESWRENERETEREIKK